MLSRRTLSQEDGQGFVGQGVEEQQRHQQEVMPADKGTDLAQKKIGPLAR